MKAGLNHDRHARRNDRRGIGNPADRLRQFWRIVHQSIDEFPDYVDHYVSRRLTDQQRIGVAGTSMGALVRYPWIKAAASYMGSGYFLDTARTIYPPLGTYDASVAAAHDEQLSPLAAYQAPGNMEKIASRPLFVWHCMRDDIVPFSEAVRLQSNLLPLSNGGSSEFVIDPNGGHRVSADGASRGVAFLREHL